MLGLQGVNAILYRHVALLLLFCVSTWKGYVRASDNASAYRHFPSANGRPEQGSGAMTSPSRLIVGISGASGVIYGVRLLQALAPMPVETHLVISPAAEKTLALETAFKLDEVRNLADVCYPASDIAAAPSSGSYKTLGMIIAPCSMRSLAEIASGSSTSLLTRAADVVLKERRRLVLMVRETPLHAVHLRNMLTVAELGGIIAPPVPAFYAMPESIEDLVRQTVGRVLDLFELNTGEVIRWGEEPADGSRPIRAIKRAKRP